MDKPKILVIGESCKDIFIYCNAIRLCPDVPVPVLNVVGQTSNPGMAKNVQRNIQQYLDCDIITNDNWENITKTRHIDKKTNHNFFRVDSQDLVPRINLESCIFDYDIVVISDYNKGFLTQFDILNISKNNSCVLLDTKKPLGSWADYCTFIKINDYEYENSKSYIKPNNNIKDRIIHTKGDEGCFYQGENFPVPQKVEVKDTSGAGDSFMAADRKSVV